ncbi:MAG: hypothetical protein RL226_325 [Bacteroidota bacterium]
MTKDQFIQAVRSPQSAVVPLRAELLNVVNEHPWFAAAHMLLCKADHTQSHIDLDKHLQRAAIYASDRTALYTLLTRERLAEQVRSFEAEINKAVEEDELLVPDLQESADVNEVVLVQEDEPSAVQAIELSEETAEVAIEVVETQEENEEPQQIELEVDEPLPPVRKAEEFDDLQREIILEAITSSIEREVAQELPELPEKVQESASKTLVGKSQYSRWLLGHAEDRKEQPTSEPLDAKKKQALLIEKFILTEPKITPGKADEYRSEDLARLSLVEDESFVTETMARIYADQGQFARAIKAYNILSLKFPEKSIYFANQIKKLQERRKSTK